MKHDTEQSWTKLRQIGLKAAKTHPFLFKCRSKEGKTVEEVNGVPTEQYQWEVDAVSERDAPLHPVTTTIEEHETENKRP